MVSRYRIGCTGWGYDDWKGGFYPPGVEPKDYLRRYAKVFSVTEVDSSYYQAPGAQQTQRWAEATPPHFEFSAKFPGDITHRAALRDVDDKVDAFLVGLAPLRRAGKLGPLVLQLPHSFRRDKPGNADALEAFLARFPRDQPLAVELRHESWWATETYRALEAAGATLVWSYHEHGRAPPVRTSDTVYARLIGDRELTRFDRVQRDHTEEMRYWRDRFEDEGLGARRIYAFVNNHLMGFAPSTAARLAEILGEPEIDLKAAMRESGQRSLLDGFG